MGDFVAGELDRVHERIAGRFARAEPRARGPTRAEHGRANGKGKPMIEFSEIKGAPMPTAKTRWGRRRPHPPAPDYTVTRDGKFVATLKGNTLRDAEDNELGTVRTY